MKKAILLGLTMILLATIMTCASARAINTDEAPNATAMYTKETSVSATSTTVGPLTKETTQTTSIATTITVPPTIPPEPKPPPDDVIWAW